MELHNKDDLRIVGVPYGHPDAVGLIARVQQVYVELYGTEDVTPMGPDDFTPPSGLFVVGYRGGEAVACGAWRAHDGPAPDFLAGDAEIKRMYVTEAARGRGYARMILRELERTAVLSGRKRAVLETGTKQPAAIALYTSSDYTEIPKFGLHTGMPEIVCYGKTLC
ncbi:GNAT superfamily N-acetyltransferase [Amycolatopsis endophytica]|uniref:GNAT superfamily N-acetyltransferase n=1 Tax=Amycolatopsis endophytica TaxID=860233 RepID=A0A853B9D8_9PSEU|nr:GNAT superfamily N-acetyltransferase [Amycolatopsis endophytica]